ncbi:MAG: hypothetical protein DRH56_10640 [Deltaproteobacteria bacterium]|nr:MAG: hypothetical protein DRH56_10640 [Deltaproteobacteria bacterium]
MNEKATGIEQVERDGWQKRFVACEPRLSEAVEMYREAGFEVRLEPLPKAASCNTCAGEETGGECRVCFEGAEDQYKIIFTRSLKTVGAGGGTIFI